TANATNEQLRDRSSHTGTQEISTVTGLQTELDAKVVVGGDLSGTPDDVLIAKIRNAALAGQHTLVSVFPDGSIEPQPMDEYEVSLNAQSTPMTSLQLDTMFPNVVLGFQVMCPLLNRVYKKFADNWREIVYVNI